MLVANEHRGDVGDDLGKPIIHDGYIIPWK